MIDPGELRRVLGQFATGVTVVTTLHDGEPYGVTVNAFCSLSLEPPQVLVCLNRANRSYAAFSGATAFAVNVLAQGQEELARLFASQEERKFGAVAFRAGEATGVPLLEGAHAWIECAIAERVGPRGTHAILIGDVRAFAPGGGEPLLFYRGRYARIRDTEV